MAESPSKRKVHPVLKSILQKDVEFTKNLLIWLNTIFAVPNYRKYYKGLEISCHGISWFAFWICFSWLFNNPSLIQMQVNMLLGLLLDIIFVALIKAYTRRRRPTMNTDDALGQFGPDIFSFPSGHASRAIFVMYFFLNLFPAPILLAPFIIVWAVAVCVSRLLLHRHHVLDVLAGVLLGIFTGLLLGVCLVQEDTALWIMSSISDEKLDGGEFHV